MDEHYTLTFIEENADHEAESDGADRVQKQEQPNQPEVGIRQHLNAGRHLKW